MISHLCGVSMRDKGSSAIAAHCCALLSQGCALLRPFEMVKCARCSETAASKCLMKQKLCGKCCWPTCGEGAHSQRHSARGKRGRISKEERWNKVWRLATERTKAMWKNVPLRRHMQESGEKFASIRYRLMKSLHQIIRDGDSEQSRSTIEAAVAMPPREQEELIESIKADFGEDDDSALPLETAMIHDDDAEPEDLDASWSKEGATASASIDASSSATPSPSERPVKRGALDWLTEDSSSGVLLDNDVVKPPPWNPQGMPALDEQHRRCSHYRRRYPALNNVPWSQSMVHALGDSPALYAPAEPILMHWLRLRPGLAESFRSVQRRSYPWRAGPGENEGKLMDMHSWGVYLYAELKEWMPKPPDDIDVVTGRSSKYGSDLESVIHASSMYSVHRATLKGLQPGPLAGKGDMKGVYCFRPNGLSTAVSSSGYAVYSWIGGSFLASPRYDIVAETYRAGEPDIGKIAVGDKQLCLKPGMYYLRGIFFHVLSRRDVARGPPIWCSWDDWSPDHELPLE